MSNLSTFYYDDYSGGLNNTTNALEIARHESSVLENWDITYQGQLRARQGLILEGNHISSNPITGLHAYLQSNGGRDLLAVEGTNLRYLNGSTWDVLDNTFVPGHRFWMETVLLGDRCFISNEDNTLRYWDRASVVLNTCLVDLGAAAPHGNVMRWHKNHLFHFNNVTVAGVVYPKRAHWSAMGDPTTYDLVNDQFDVPGDGRVITAVDLGNHLVIFNERSIQLLSGWGSADWAITSTSSNVSNIDQRIGCIAPRGATKVGDEVWFIDNQGIIRKIFATEFDTFRQGNVSTKIQGTLAGLNQNQISRAVAWTHIDKVYFAIPTGTSSTNDLVLVFDLIAHQRTNQEAWTTYTGWVPSLFTSFPASVLPDLYVADATTGNVYLHAGTDDNGVAISARRDGKQDNFNKPERFKRYKFGYITGEAGGNISVDILASVDAGSFADLGELHLVGTGSRLGPTGSFFLGPTGDCQLGGNSQAEKKYYFTDGGGSARGKTVKTSIRFDGLGGSPVVNGHTIHFKERVLR